MELYEKNGNVLYILNVLKKYSDESHILKTTQIQTKIKELYNVEIDTRTIRRNINLLRYKLEYDISTREENGKGYFIYKNPETDFEQGEIRAIIDTFNYAKFITPSIAKSIIKKCKNLQNIYENRKLKDYKIYVSGSKTDNMEVIKNIEDISEAILNLNKIKFEYWKYKFTDKITKEIVSTPKVTPYAIVYNKQEFYLIAIKEGQDTFYHYRLDRIRNIKQLNEKRTIEKTSKQIQEFAESTVEMFGGDKEEIEVECKMFLLDNIIEEFGNNIKITKLDEETIRFTTKTSTMGFRMWAMRNIDFATVIKPVKLRKEMIDIINKAKNNYN